MHKKRKQKVIWISLIGFGLILSVSLILYALRQNINLYLTPKQVLHEHIKPATHFRLGGLVKKGSVKRSKKTVEVRFVLTDFKNTIVVVYKGLLPSLFREGQGIVAEGQLNKNGVFIADHVLAKHDANYHPPRVPKKVVAYAD